MKYGIVENYKFILIDDDLQRLKNTLPFMPKWKETDIAPYEDSEIEQGYDGAWYEKGHARQRPLEEARADKLTEINSACDAILNAATATYPETEVLTFDQQLIEAQAYTADDTAAVPLLRALAAARGIELDDLVQRVIAKSNAFTQLSGYIIGQRQALEDRLDTCTTADEIEAITVDIPLPEMVNAETI